MRLDRAKAKRYNIYITRRRGSPACGSPSRLQRGRMKGNGPRARRGHMIVCVSTGWNSHACETAVFYGIAAANAACILIERKKGPVETETGALTCLLELGAQGGREAPAVRNKSGKVGAGMESLSGACAAERLSSPNTAMKAAFSRTIGLFHESKT